MGNYVNPVGLPQTPPSVEKDLSKKVPHEKRSIQEVAKDATKELSITLEKREYSPPPFPEFIVKVLNILGFQTKEQRIDKLQNYLTENWQSFKEAASAEKLTLKQMNLIADYLNRIDRFERETGTPILGRKSEVLGFNTSQLKLLNRANKNFDTLYSAALSNEETGIVKAVKDLFLKIIDTEKSALRSNEPAPNTEEELADKPPPRPRTPAPNIDEEFTDHFFTGVQQSEEVTAPSPLQAVVENLGSSHKVVLNEEGFSKARRKGTGKPSQNSIACASALLQAIKEEKSSAAKKICNDLMNSSWFLDCIAEEPELWKQFQDVVITAGGEAFANREESSLKMSIEIVAAYPHLKLTFKNGMYLPANRTGLGAPGWGVTVTSELLNKIQSNPELLKELGKSRWFQDCLKEDEGLEFRYSLLTANRDALAAVVTNAFNALDWIDNRHYQEIKLHFDKNGKGDHGVFKVVDRRIKENRLTGLGSKSKKAAEALVEILEASVHLDPSQQSRLMEKLHNNLWFNDCIHARGNEKLLERYQAACAAIGKSSEEAQFNHISRVLRNGNRFAKERFLYDSTLNKYYISSEIGEVQEDVLIRMANEAAKYLEDQFKKIADNQESSDIANKKAKLFKEARYLIDDLSVIQQNISSNALKKTIENLEQMFKEDDYIDQLSFEEITALYKSVMQNIETRKERIDKENIDNEKVTSLLNYMRTVLENKKKLNLSDVEMKEEQTHFFNEIEETLTKWITELSDLKIKSYKIEMTKIKEQKELIQKEPNKEGVDRNINSLINYMRRELKIIKELNQSGIQIKEEQKLYFQVIEETFNGWIAELEALKPPTRA